MRKPKDSKEDSRMVIVTVHLPKTYIEVLDQLVKLRYYPNRAEAIRTAVRDMIVNEVDLLAKSREENIQVETSETEQF